MKLFYTYSLLFFTAPLFAQDTPLFQRIQEQVVSTEVVLLDSFPASQLYFNSVLFLNDAFRGARETSQLKDEKARSVATKGSFPVNIENGYGEEINAKVVFTLIIQSQENRYKYMLNDFYFAFTEESGITSYASFNDHRGLSMTPKQWQEVEKHSEDFIRLFVADLKQQMAQKDILCKEMLTLQRKKSKAK